LSCAEVGDEGRGSGGGGEFIRLCGGGDGEYQFEGRASVGIEFGVWDSVIALRRMGYADSAPGAVIGDRGANAKGTPSGIA
jgi:hypothetical protein